MLETERLWLRPFTENDAEGLYGYLSKPAVNCFMDMKIESIEKAKDEALKRASDSEFYFAIELKENGKVIGEIFAFPEPSEHSEENSEKNSHCDTFSLCWMLNTSYQGKGYAFEAIRMFVDYLFKEKGARRLYAYTEDYNLASRRLCEKLGMRREGVFLEFISFVKNPDGTPKYENTMQYAILKREWELK